MTANRGRTTIRMREDLLEWLKDIAYLQGKTLSQVLNEAVECYIEKMRAEEREALLKAREALEQLRKQQAQASSPVNEANGIEKDVVGVKNENAEAREALIKARQYLEQLRKRRAQASQASSPVNEANEVDEVDAEGEE